MIIDLSYTYETHLPFQTSITEYFCITLFAPFFLVFLKDLQTNEVDLSIIKTVDNL